MDIKQIPVSKLHHIAVKGVNDSRHKFESSIGFATEREGERCKVPLIKALNDSLSSQIYYWASLSHS